ncbi:MAG: hypothetical protein QGH51_08440 [Planctomycetota bacterium]|jgi:hypothetical protein|nr:hypothetical protein [Planctomycetota bacterium]
MSANRTLISLALFCVAAGAARLWVGGQHSDYDEGFTSHKKAYQVIFETVQDLSLRRSEIILGEEESSFMGYISGQARRAHIGTVTINPNTKPKGNQFLDTTMTVSTEDKSSGFARSAIAGFLYNVEAVKRSMKFRTTNLKISAANPSDKRGRPVKKGAEREDLWRIDNLVFKRRMPADKKR